MSVVKQDRQPRSVSNRDRLGRPANRSSFHLYLNTKGKPPHLYLLVPEKSNGIRNQITEIHPNYLYLRKRICTENRLQSFASKRHRLDLPACQIRRSRFLELL